MEENALNQFLEMFKTYWDYEEEYEEEEDIQDT